MARAPQIYNLGTSMRETGINQMTEATTDAFGIMSNLNSVDDELRLTNNLKRFSQGKVDDHMAANGYVRRKVQIVGKSGKVYRTAEENRDQLIAQLRKDGEVQ